MANARLLTGLLGLNIGLTGALYYQTTKKFEEHLEEVEARFDEVEGTLRGHIGLIEDSLKRIEDHQQGKPPDGSSWGSGMSKRGEEMYMQRGKDERKKK